ncbi:hypothetical protein [Caulobacter soli]|uniref:hypothetical protein n=1 Tax=Caulobacter soli TaxID=2708539 RepID=UPI0013EB0B19|nr:hypothetical protein [Caulobacter soli]
MNDKVARPLFHPAPRPRPINDGVATEALKEATRDLGFGRTSSDMSAALAEPHAEPQAKPAPPAPIASAPKPAAPSPAPRPKASKPVRAAAVAASDADRGTSIKFEIDDALSMALKFEAVRRRVTVKYLILEALAAKDFPVDLANLPQDGRRVRG